MRKQDFHDFFTVCVNTLSWNKRSWFAYVGKRRNELILGDHKNFRNLNVQILVMTVIYLGCRSI